ncbi:IS21 family transposase, partial [Bacillus sp. P2(2020)]|nr:IS21 family transposase [Calidifontibacillus erzurumensis]
VAGHFTNEDEAAAFLEEVRKKRQRYIRDQLQMILREIKRIDQKSIIDIALRECMKKKLFCATDFIDMVRYIERQRQIHMTIPTEKEGSIHSVNIEHESLFQTTSQKRDVNEYLAVLEGQA